MFFHELQDLLSNRPSVRVSIYMSLEAERINQLEPGMKDFVTLVQDISNIRMNPLLKVQPLGVVRTTVSNRNVLVTVANRTWNNSLLIFQLSQPLIYVANEAAF